MRFMTLVLSALLLVMTAGATSARGDDCMRTINGAVICPPPNGSMITDLKGNIVCGPGQCARDAGGKAKCSSRPGGVVVLDNTGHVLCVGGCVEGAASYCETPTR